jgi:hypothetical protein
MVAGFWHKLAGGANKKRRTPREPASLIIGTSRLAEGGKYSTLGGEQRL